MTLRTGAAGFLTLLCFWLAALMAIGAVTVAGADSNCKSLTNPNAFKKHAIFPFSFVSVSRLTLFSNIADCESPNPPTRPPGGGCSPPQRSGKGTSEGDRGSEPTY
jgi:hypothetical protein